MPTLIDDPRNSFIDLIELEQSRVQLEPHIMFICGGSVDVSTMSNHSIRNMFMNISGGAGDKANGFVLAKNFKDWEKGYQSLSEFENDIAFLSSLVVVFLESEGALTEFGLFFGNKHLREKLVVVLHEEFHKSESFIKFGLLDPMEHKDQRSVRVYEIDHRDIDNVNSDEVKDILDDILSHCDEKNKSEKFDVKNRGHIIFLIYQVIELFFSLTKTEIKNYTDRMGVNLENKDLDAALYILQKFNLVDMEKKSSQYFFFVPNGLTHRINFNFKTIERRYDTAAIKISVNDYYEQASKVDPSHKRRMKIISTLLTGVG
jgi:hypothetical protein